VALKRPEEPLRPVAIHPNLAELYRRRGAHPASVQSPVKNFHGA